MSLMENAQQYIDSGATNPDQMQPMAGEGDVAKLYENLAPQAGGYANALSEQIGQAQRSMGPLAGQAMGQSQTAGLGNYTYNRLMRPQVDTMRDDILVKGYAEQLNQLLSDALNNAKSNYNKSRSGGGGGGGNGGGGGTNGDLIIEDEVVPDKSQTKLYLTTSEAYNLAAGEGRKYNKSELEAISGRPMTDQSYSDYSSMYDKNKSRIEQQKSNSVFKNINNNAGMDPSEWLPKGGKQVYGSF